MKDKRIFFNGDRARMGNTVKTEGEGYGSPVPRGPRRRTGGHRRDLLIVPQMYIFDNTH